MNLQNDKLFSKTGGQWYLIIWLTTAYKHNPSYIPPIISENRSVNRTRHHHSARTLSAISSWMKHCLQHKDRSSANNQVCPCQWKRERAHVCHVESSERTIFAFGMWCRRRAIMTFWRFRLRQWKSNYDAFTRVFFGHQLSHRRKCSIVWDVTGWEWIDINAKEAF